ncbi:MAG TPA: hypothetical protein VH416_01690 [Gaiellaceae bacterium]|jgi:hypothetical protein
MVVSVRATTLIGTGVVAALFGLGCVGAAAGVESPAAKKVTLRVVVVGNGRVVSRPAGIKCPGKCRLRVKRGTRVVLRETPAQGSQFSRWTGGCGAAASCTARMSRGRAVTATFKASPPPPPPPPAIPGKPGHYVGTYTDGTHFNFDEDAAGTSVSHFDFDNNGHCGNGGTVSGGINASGPYPLQSDGTFSIDDGFTDPNQTKIAFKITGRISADGSAGGSLHVDVSFADGTACASDGTWSAHVQ